MLEGDRDDAEEGLRRGILFSKSRRARTTEVLGVTVTIPSVQQRILFCGCERVVPRSRISNRGHLNYF
jgi:hypothetical protein